jgi:hypothetical protein
VNNLRDITSVTTETALLVTKWRRRAENRRKDAERNKLSSNVSLTVADVFDACADDLEAAFNLTPVDDSSTGDG